MGETMDFPKTPQEFIEQNKFKDSEEVYTNGADLVPVFRVKQMIEHYIPADVAPVVHGAWEEHYEEDGFVHHRCSKCRKNAFYEYKTIPLYEEDNDGEIVDCGVMKLDIIEQLTSFCPHCGAKMDEEEKHETD